MSEFIPGLKLSGLFYKEVVKPLLKSHFPKIPYSAGLIGPGSETLGFDTPQSMDHHWGPRLQLFFSRQHYNRYKNDMDQVLRHNLPYKFRGFSTNFSVPNPEDNNVRLPEQIIEGPVNHLIEIVTVEGFFMEFLGLNPLRKIRPMQWQTIPEYKLLHVTSGKVFHDGLSELKKIQQKLKYYPKDIWLYMLAKQWMKISEEEAFIGRCHALGDELGAQIITTRQISRLMKLCFLMEKQYAPYSKWMGTAFSKLNCSKILQPILNDVLKSTSAKKRETTLSKAYEKVARMHNALRITKPLETNVRPFHNRPYMVIGAERFANEIRKKIKNKEVRKLFG